MFGIDYFNANKNYIKSLFPLSCEICLGLEGVVITTKPNELRECILKTKDIIIKANCLIGIFASHYPGSPHEFKISYLFLSLSKNLRFRITVDIALDEIVPSISDLYQGSVWYEREIFDMFGIKFTGAKDMRRILTDYNFQHHPLRKDYPLVGYEEVRYDFESQSVQYHPTNLAQEYRNFDFETPWNPEVVFDKIKHQND